MSLEHAPARCGPDQHQEGRWLRAPDAAAYLGLSTSTLAKMRLRGDGPNFSKIGPRIVTYHTKVLDTYLTERSRRSTSEAV
jgi:predicted DNA-binding transcriptional regulator AlpA